MINLSIFNPHPYLLLTFPELAASAARNSLFRKALDPNNYLTFC